MSNIEKRKPFSPVDGKRLLQQHNRPQKGHRRGKVHGGTNKTSSSKDENSSLASLVDDAGFDFLTNPKPEAITKPMQNEASAFWSSTSKTPKISNVTLTTLQSEVLGKPNHGNTSNPPIHQFNAGKTTSGKPSQPTTKPMPPIQPLANLPPKSTPQHSVRSFPKKGQDPSRKSRAKISSLDTIVEGTPEQERESPPSDPMPATEVEKESELLSSLQIKGSYPHEVQKVHGPTEGEQHNKQINDDASAHNSDMDESSDDDLMNLTLSPPKIEKTTESDLPLNQSDLLHIKGKPPRPSNIQQRFKQSALSTRFIDQDKQESIAPDHCHTPRASQSEVKQSTPYPAESLLMPPPKPLEKRCRLTKLETSSPLVSGHLFQGANSNRKEHAPPSINENETVYIPSAHQHKDPNRRSRSNVESMVTERIADESSNKKRSISDVDLDKSGDEKIDRVKISTNNHPKNRGIAKASVGDGRIEDENHPEVSLKDPSRKRTQTTTQAESMRENKAVATQNPKLIVHGHRLPAETSFPRSPPKVSYNLSNGIRQVKSASKSGEERKRSNAFMQQEEGNDEMGLPTSHHVEIHQKTKRIASEHNNPDNEPQNNYQRLGIDRLQAGSTQVDALKSEENALNEEMKPHKTEATQADIINRVRQIKTDVPVKEQGNHVPAGRDGAMLPDNAVEQSNTKRTSVEPLDKEVWRAMMASTQESKKSTSGFLGMVIETPAQRGDHYDSQSVDGSELTQDTIFLIDRVKNSHLNQSRRIQTTSPTCTTSNNPHDVQREQNWTTLQSTCKNEKHHEGAMPHCTVEAKAEKYTKDSGADQRSQSKQGLLSPGNVVPTTQNTPAIKRSNVNEKIRNEKSHVTTKNPCASIPNSAVQFSTPFPTISTSAPADLVASASTAGRQMLHILQDDVHSELLSMVTKTAQPKRLQPALWTSEIAGSKVKALGVNAAPIFRLEPGNYFRHAPLPPGWTIAVSRSHNIPFYIHPDFGATFYSPVPLPSSDGEVQGTTLLYQADTPEYRPPEQAVSKSQAASTPIIFGLTKSFGSTDTTSSCATHRYENIVKETPIGALIVATNDQFSEMIPGENKNKGLHEHLQVPPIETPIDQQFVVASPNNESESRHEGDSTDSMTTVTIVSSHKLQKDSIPTEIEIINHENAADDEKFQMHLDATAEKAEYQRNVTSIALPETTPGKNRYNVVPENKSAHNNDSKSSASINSNDASLDWAAGISMDSSSSETLAHAEDVIVLHQNRSNATTSRTFSKNNTEQSSGKNFRQSIDSQESDYISFAVDNYDHSPSIPQRVIVGIDNDGDDVSRLQCTPIQQEHTTTISSRFKPAPLSAHHAETISALFSNIDKIDGFYEEHSHHSAASRSYASTQSGLSIASRRSLHPLLPLCSLQNLQFIKVHKESEKKRKKKPKRKQAKRQRTVQTVPISA